MDVRRLTHNDSAVLKDIWLRALADTPTAFGARYTDEVAKPESYWQELTQQIVGATDQMVLVASIESHVCGLIHALIDPQQRDVVQLGAMWIDPAVRRQGIARELVDMVTAWAQHEHVHRLALWVTEGNLVAIQTYERLGFQDTGQRAAFPTNPMLAMRQMTRACMQNL